MRKDSTRYIASRPRSAIQLASPHAFYALHEAAGETTITPSADSLLGAQALEGTLTAPWGSRGWLTFDTGDVYAVDTSDEALTLGDVSSAAHGIVVAFTMYATANPTPSGSEVIVQSGDSRASENGWYVDFDSFNKLRCRVETASASAGTGAGTAIDLSATNTVLIYMDTENGQILKRTNLDATVTEACTSWPTQDTTGRGMTFFCRQAGVGGTWQQWCGSKGTGMQLQNLLILQPQTNIADDFDAISADMAKYPNELAKLFDGV